MHICLCSIEYIKGEQVFATFHTYFLRTWQLLAKMNFRETKGQWSVSPNHVAYSWCLRMSTLSMQLHLNDNKVIKKSSFLKLYYWIRIWKIRANAGSWIDLRIKDNCLSKTITFQVSLNYAFIKPKTSKWLNIKSQQLLYIVLIYFLSSKFQCLMLCNNQRDNTISLYLILLILLNGRYYCMSNCNPLRTILLSNEIPSK